jgi:hypothetical protein
VSLVVAVLSLGAAIAPARAQAQESPKVTCVENLKPRDGWRRTLPIKDAPVEKTTPVRNCDGANVRWIVRMEDPIAIHVSGLSQWRAVGDNSRVVLHLYIAGIEIRNLTPSYQGQDPVTKDDIVWTPLKFESDKDANESRDTWAYVLRIARVNKNLPISVGPAGGPYWESMATIEINPYPTLLSSFAAAVVLGLVVVLIWAGIQTRLLRDNTAAVNPPYSLARHQMACWFAVVISAYLFVTMTTGVAAATSATALTLIGISGATGLAAVALDKSKRLAAATARRELAAEQASLDEALNAPETGLLARLATVAQQSEAAVEMAATIETKRRRLHEVNDLLATPADPPAESRSWTSDLLSDESGISFHRLQIAAWTVVLIGTFVVAVWRTFAMPEFDATTLGLMGISSGMYLGFKFPERVSQ